jgi:hypothetical protein
MIDLAEFIFRILFRNVSGTDFKTAGLFLETTRFLKEEPVGGDTTDRAIEHMHTTKKPPCGGFFRRLKDSKFYRYLDCRLGMTADAQNTKANC